MQCKISSEAEYRQIMERVETYLQKSTRQGGFHTLTAPEKEELPHFSLLVESLEGRGTAHAYTPTQDADRDARTKNV